MGSTPAPANRLAMACGPGPGARTGQPGRPARSGPLGRAVHAILTIPGRPEHVATARRFVAAVLGDDHPLTDTAILLTSELVTNSLQHSSSGREGAAVSVAADRAPGGLRVEVTDGGAGTVPTPRQVGREAEQGRGLCLVDALATRWATRREGSGTVTWFEIAS